MEFGKKKSLKQQAQIKPRTRKSKDSVDSSLSSNRSSSRIGALGNYRAVSRALEDAYQKVIANPIEDPELEDEAESSRLLKTQYIRSLSSLEKGARSKSPKNQNRHTQDGKHLTG